MESIFDLSLPFGGYRGNSLILHPWRSFKLRTELAVLQLINVRRRINLSMLLSGEAMLANHH